MPLNVQNVAVIGAGLGGCAVAIALSKQGFPVTVYESRPEGSEVLLSGVLLSPNGLRVLDHLGVYSRIKGKCYTSNRRTFKNDRDETVSKVISADASLHGFDNHRLWRSILLDEMKGLLAEQGVTIEYSSRFEGILAETEDGTTFAINGSHHRASLLVGADGIHSAVRQYVAPGVEPHYTGTTGVLAHVPRASVAWPYDDYERNATIQGKPNAIFFIPEDPSANLVMTGLQVSLPKQSRADLDQLQRDKDRLISFYKYGYDEHGETAKSIIDAVVANKESAYIWPYMKMPSLESWCSKPGRVIIVGDAAHALIPSSAQGVNQALEDAYTLALVLSSLRCAEGLDLPSTLATWQSRRQKRIDAVLDWATNVTNVSRLPEEERAKLKSGGRLDNRPNNDLTWLYGYDVAKDFEDLP